MSDDWENEIDDEEPKKEESKKEEKKKQGYAIMPLVDDTNTTVTDTNSKKYEGASCWEYGVDSCESNSTFACVWVQTGEKESDG